MTMTTLGKQHEKFLKTLRKKRTLLLIQKGALLNNYFESNHLSIVKTEELLKIFANYVNANKPDQYKKDKLMTKNYPKPLSRGAKV